MTRFQPDVLILLLLIAAGPVWTACGRSAPVGEAPDAAEPERGLSASDAASERHPPADDHDDRIVRLSPEAVERAGIATAPTALRSFAGELTTTGEVGFDERRIAHVTPRLGGRVVEIEAELGDRVEAGRTLAVIDSIELGKAKAAYLRARAHHEVARVVHERRRRLYEQGIASEEEALEAEADARAEAAELAAAEETLHLYGMDHEAIRRLHADDPEASLFVLRAPFDGKVVAKEVALGEIVDPNRTLFTVADLSVVWVWIDLYERDLRHVALGDEARVAVDAYPGEELVGRVTYVGDEVRPESRTVRARLDLGNPGERLRPGMFARVALSGPERTERVLAIPREAVQRHEDGDAVFVALGGNRFERRMVRLGRRGEAWVRVLSGLEEGEEVVTRGAFLVRSQASEDALGGGHHH